MSEGDLIRAHDPFSGHEPPAPAEDTPEPTPVPEAPTPPPEPAKKAPARKPAARRGRRPRKIPTDAEVEAARAAVKK